MFVCVRGGGEEGGECEEDQNSSISLHVSEMFKLLGAFTPEMPITQLSRRFHSQVNLWYQIFRSLMSLAKLL